MKRTAVLMAAMICAPFTAYAENTKFQQFLLKQAHNQGFTKCDAAIKSAFNLADGSDLRAITQAGAVPDSLKVIAVWGNIGDTVYSEAEFHKRGATCSYTQTSTLASTKSCAAEAASLPAFKFEAETVGVLFTRNVGGINRILIPAGPQACTVVFLKSGEA